MAPKPVAAKAEPAAKAVDAKNRKKGVFRFDQGYRSLQQYVEETQSFPNKDVVYNGVSIGAWLHKMLRKLDNLPDIQREALERLPNWDAMMRSRVGLVRNRTAFLSMVRLLGAYVEEHKTLPRQKEGAELRLGQWVNTVRKMHRTGKLSEDRVSALEQIPGWSWSLRNRTGTVRHSFDDMVEHVKSFLERERRMPKNREDVGDVAIGTWCLNRRIAHKKGLLSADVKAKLDAIPGWTWDGPGRGGQVAPRKPYTRAKEFESNLETLRKFVDAHFRLPVSQEKYDDFGIGNWCLRMRGAHKRGALPPERIAALEAVPMWKWQQRAGTESE